MIAVMAIWTYETASSAAMMNAAEPSTGGASCPPVDAVASIAAAMCGG